MPESKKPAAAPKRIIDVTHADKTSPSDTSRPVIITNRPILKDPMMSDISAADKSTPELMPTSDQPKVKSAGTIGEKVVEPTAAKAETEPAIAEAEPSTSKSEPSAVETETTEPSQESPAPDETDDKPAASVEPDQVPDTKSDTPPAKPPTETPADVSRGKLATDPEASEDIEASKQAEHEAAVQKLIDSKQYYLPIETTEHRRSKRFVALGIVLSLVLAVAWVDIALDANLIHIQGVKPPTHFFSN